jgi:Ca2+-binding RTX toxin-like protein
MPYATDYTTELTGSYWSGAEVTGQPVFITYSFDATKPASDAGNLTASAYNTFTPFTAAQQTEAQQALGEWSAASGIIFEQVAPGQGDINFASYNFSSDPDAMYSGGEGFYPWGNWNYYTAVPSTPTTGVGGYIHFAADLPGAGNVLMNTASGFETNGLFAYNTMLHEIGHALGLKHPTDAWDDDVGGEFDHAYNQWDPNTPYNPNFSVMTPGANTLTHLTADDKLAISSIYGTSAQQAEQDASWSWDDATDTLTQVLKPGGWTVRGVSTSNNITGGGGADSIYAIGAGTNTIYGKGGSGVNFLDGGAGADVLNGWFGVTYAIYWDAPVAVTVDLRDVAMNTGDAAGDTYLHVSNIQGSNYNDTIIGDDSGDLLYGRAGNDSITGGAGADYLYGGGGDDTLIGGGGTNYLDGGAGADRLDGTGGTSYATYGDAASGVTVNLLNTAADTGDAAGDVFVNIHDVKGSNYADSLSGDNAGDYLYGLGGDDTLTGGTGTDYLYGGVGKDTLIGGAGTNYLDGGVGADVLNGTGGTSYAMYADAATGVTVNLLNPSTDTGDAAGDSFIAIHDVRGSNYADAITGDNAGDYLYGLNGNDTLTGGTGNDYIFGGVGNDTLIGGAGTNYLDGGAGADVLNGLGGTSYAYYGDATTGVTVNLLNPSLNTGDAAGDTYDAIENVRGSNYADTITGDNAGDTLYGLNGDDTITGGTGSDHLYGGAGKDTLIGGAGVNYLDGGAGADVLNGNGGTSYASYGDAVTGVTVNLLNPSLDTGDAAGDSFVNVHDVTGSAYADKITGDNAGDTLWGLVGDDTIVGGTGADFIDGGAGKDTLTGGGGADKFATRARARAATSSPIFRMRRAMFSIFRISVLAAACRRAGRSIPASL